LIHGRRIARLPHRLHEAGYLFIEWHIVFSASRSLKERRGKGREGKGEANVADCRLTWKQRGESGTPSVFEHIASNKPST
jgi:hypothetical protein